MRREQLTEKVKHNNADVYNDYFQHSGTSIPPTATYLELSKEEKRADKARRKVLLKHMKQTSIMRSDKAQFFKNYLMNDYI